MSQATSSRGAIVKDSQSSLAPDFGARIPKEPKVELPGALAAVPTAPALEQIEVTPWWSDMTAQTGEQPLGQRLTVSGKVTDSDGNPIPGVLIELWQCNASGTYRDLADPKETPVDPNFLGAGRCLSDGEGNYSFTTIRPAAYPGPAGSGIPYRPAHIHVSLMGPDLGQRTITQLYFEGDPLFERDFVVGAMEHPEERPALLATYEPDATVHGGAERTLGYHWDIVLGGAHGVPMEW